MATGRAKVSATATRAKVRPPRLYVYFDAVATRGSIRKAADSLFIASSALTRQILELEDQVGTALFERVPSGVRLTPAGELLHSHVRETLAALKATCLGIDDLGGLVHGTVRLASTETVAVEALPCAIALFQQIHPGVVFELSILSGQIALGRLLGDQVDVVVLLNPNVVAGLHVQHSTAQDMCAVVRVDHPLAKKKSITLQECAAYPLGVPELGMGGRLLLDELAARQSLALTPSLVANSMEALKAFVRHSNGVAFQLASGLTRNVRLREVCAIPLADPAVSSKLVIATRKGRLLSQAAAAFLEHLKATLWT